MTFWNFKKNWNNICKVFVKMPWVSFLIFLLLTLNSLAMQAQLKPDDDLHAQASKMENGKFINQLPSPMMTGDESMFKVMRKWMKGTPNGRPSEPLKTALFEKKHFIKNTDSITYTWFGHSSLLINFKGTIILTDPVFSKYASPVPFSNKSFDYTQNYTVESLPNTDIVVISHDHYDHLDKKSIKKLIPKTKQFYVPLKVKKRLISWGVPGDKIVEADWWNSFTDISGVKLTATPARHFSGRGLTNRNTTLWCAWALEKDGQKVFFGGDSGYSPHFKTIGKQLGPFDLTFLECGQYNENWRFIHSLPEETVLAHIDLQGKTLVPIHWGKFKLSLHSWTEPLERAKAEATKQNVELEAPTIGALNKLHVNKPQLISVEN